jgi:hypothetical protein
MMKEVIDLGQRVDPRTTRLPFPAAPVTLHPAAVTANPDSGDAVPRGDCISGTVIARKLLKPMFRKHGRLQRCI